MSKLSLHSAVSPRRRPSSCNRPSSNASSFDTLLGELCESEGIAQRQADAMDRRAEAENARLQSLRETHERLEEKRNDAASERVLRPKRVAGAQRCSLWLQVLCSFLTVDALKTAWDEETAMNTLKNAFLPMIWRRRHKQRCLQRANDAREKGRILREAVTPPTVADLAKIGFFKNWSPIGLEHLVNSMWLCEYSAGDFIVMQGDWGSCMYLIQEGTVEVSIRNPKRGGKSHKNETLKLAQITPESERPFFGEFSLLANEPRSASCVATTRCVLWVVEKSVVDQALLSLSDTVRHDMAIVADSRRTQLLATIHPLTADVLRDAHPLFSCWTEDVLRSVIKLFEARVCRPDVEVFKENDPGLHFFIVASGDVVIRQSRRAPLAETSASPKAMDKKGLGMSSPRSPRRSPSVAPPNRLPALTVRENTSSSEPREVAHLHTGDSFGENAVLFLDRRAATAVTTSRTDLWQLPKAALLDVLTSYPAWYMHAKEVTNALRASRLDPQPYGVWHSATLMTHGVPLRLWKELTAKATPLVIEANTALLTKGGAVAHISLVVWGRLLRRDSEVVYGPGSLVGVGEACTFQPHSLATVVSEQRVELWQVPLTQLHSAMKTEYPAELKKMTAQDVLSQAADTLGVPVQDSAEIRRTLGIDRDKKLVALKR